MLAFSGLRDESLYFKVDEGHFYDRQQHKCAYSQFSELFNDSSNERIECQAELGGGLHSHPVLPRQYVEISIIGWASKLRILRHSAEESNAQVVEIILSAWPHKLSLLPDASTLAKIFSETFRKYRDLVERNSPQVQLFLSNYGNEKLAEIFCKVIMRPQRYWPQPILVHQKGGIIIIFGFNGSDIQVIFRKRC